MLLKKFLSGVDAGSFHGTLTILCGIRDRINSKEVYMDVSGIKPGIYVVKAAEVESPFIAYWNGRKWVHGAMKYNINIHTWIKT